MCSCLVRLTAFACRGRSNAVADSLCAASCNSPSPAVFGSCKGMQAGQHTLQVQLVPEPFAHPHRTPGHNALDRNSDAHTAGRYRAELLWRREYSEDVASRPCTCCQRPGLLTDSQTRPIEQIFSTEAMWSSITYRPSLVNSHRRWTSSPSQSCSLHGENRSLNKLHGASMVYNLALAQHGSALACMRVPQVRE